MSLKDVLKVPMKLQFFAEGEDGSNPNNPQQQATPQAPEFDYEKLASLINGKQSVTEDTVLKSYFKQQGLSKDEMDSAIAAFKKQKAESTPDIAQLQADKTKAEQQALKAVIEAKAQMIAFTLGIDAKTIPYVLKLADLSQLSLDSKDEDVQAVLNKVLEDVPALKPAQDASSSRFQQVGAPSGGNNPSQTDEALKRAFGIK